MFENIVVQVEDNIVDQMKENTLRYRNTLGSLGFGTKESNNIGIVDCHTVRISLIIVCRQFN